MTEPTPERSAVELLRFRRLHLVEVPPPRVPSEEQAAMNRVWNEATRANPRLFDGAVAACAGLRSESEETLVIVWARTTYRHYALRRVPGATALLPSLGAAVVQPTDDGCLLAGRMASWTAAPGRWQLPGGGVEPPDGDEPLDLAALRRHAAKELVEETGVRTRPDDLTPWCVARGQKGNAVALFLAPPRPAPLLRERHATLASAAAAAGRDPELDRIALLRSPADLTALDGPSADFLAPVLRRYAEEALRRDDGLASPGGA